MEAKVALDKTQHELATLREALGWEIEERKKSEALRTEGPRSLRPFEQMVYSQNGEDGVIGEIFRRIGAPTRTFVEIGVGDGWQNNSLFLLCQGWRGTWFDAADDCLATLASWPLDCARDVKPVIERLNRENIAAVLTGAGVPREPDLLSLDVDQNTYHLWEALREWRPRLAVIEYNGVLPASTDWKVPYSAEKVWDGSLNYGASLKALERLGRSLGYTLVYCEAKGVNAFFVRDDLVGDRFAGPFTAEEHYMPLRFQHDRGLAMNRKALLSRDPDTPASGG